MTIAQENRLRVIKDLLQPYSVLYLDKVRLGNRYDGGYVCLDDFDGIVIAHSGGVGFDVSWDKAIADRGIEVRLYDHSIRDLPEQHPRFSFSPNRIVGNGNASRCISLTHIARNTREDTAILKLDIEQDEWEVFDATSIEDLCRWRQIIVEFHAFDNTNNDVWYQRALRVLRKLNEGFAVVHVHPNNFGKLIIVHTVTLPQVLEVTYANRRRYTFRKSDEPYHTPIDYPNNPRAPEMRF